MDVLERSARLSFPIVHNEHTHGSPIHSNIYDSLASAPISAQSTTRRTVDGSYSWKLGDEPEILCDSYWTMWYCYSVGHRFGEHVHGDNHIDIFQ